MMDDNNQPAAASGFSTDRPSIVAMLYLANFVAPGLAALIAVVLAYVWKGEPHATWEDSHFQFHIRTFWISIGLAIIATILTVITFGLGAFIAFPAVAVWYVVRAVKALIASQKAQPLPNPATWLF